MSKSNNLIRTGTNSISKENILMKSKSKEKSIDSIKLSQVINTINNSKLKFK